MTTKPNSGTVRVSRERRSVLAMVLNALDRDAEDGKAIRGEMASELRSLLAQPADQQGEPVAFPRNGFTTLEVGRGKYKIVTTYQNRDDMWSDYAALCKAERPATAKVVLPERMPGISHTDSYEEGWNACLDEVAKLNGEKL